MATVLDILLAKEKLFSLGKNFTFSGTSFEKKVLIKNPSASAINMVIFRIAAMPNINATTSQLNSFDLRIRKNPTITTDGTAINERNCVLGASDTTGINSYSDPTISGTGGTIITRVISINQETLFNFPIILTPGNNLLIELAVNDSNNGIYFQAIYGEENV